MNMKTNIFNGNLHYYKQLYRNLLLSITFIDIIIIILI